MTSRPTAFDLVTKQFFITRRILEIDCAENLSFTVGVLAVVCDRKIIESNNMVAFTMKDVRRLGIEEVVQRAIEHVSPK